MAQRSFKARQLGIHHADDAVHLLAPFDLEPLGTIVLDLRNAQIGVKVSDQLIMTCLLDTKAFPRSQVLFFNRWGDEVFRSAIPYRNNWEGAFNGEDLPPGTYFLK